MSGETAPAIKWMAVTPHDTDNLRMPARSVYVHSAGLVACVGADDGVEIFRFADGEIKPLAPKRINAAGTTATGIIALW